MKNIVFKILLSILLVIPISCSEEFLEVENRNSLTTGTFYQTQQDFTFAVNSCYTPLAQVGLYGRAINLVFGSLSDRILFESPNWDQFAVVSPAGSGEVDNVWRACYMGFYRTNVLIKELQDNAETGIMEQDAWDLYMGQAKALRAAYSFYLVVLFNQPMFYDESSIPQDPNYNPENGDPVDFWNMIENDLTEAIDLLPATFSGENIGRVTSGAAGAMLGRAMLYKHFHYYVKNGLKGTAEDIADLTTGRDALEQVVNSQVYSLIQPMEPKSRNDYLYALLCNTSFMDLPAGENVYESENNAESVWEIQFSDARAGNFYLPGWMVTGSMLGQYFGPHGSSFKNHEVHPDFFLAFETEGAPEGFDRDPRAYASIYINGDTLDFRPDSPFYRTYLSGLHNKRVASGRGLIAEDDPVGTTGYGIKKHHFPVYYDLAAPQNHPHNMNMIRYAGVLLMYAEAEFLLGNTTGPGLDALNEVRQRVDMPLRTELSAENIIHERDVELAFEGHRFLDLVRWSFDPAWGIDMQRIYDRQLGPNSTGDFYVTGKHEYLPIPLREINLSNGKMRQNNGW